MKNIYTTIVLVLTFCVHLQAQYYEISLDQKMNNAHLVIEGEVVESESFRFDDKHIYTAHKIKVYKTFKTDPKTNHISIITRGGKLDGVEQTWTHMLTLSIGQGGVFFLEKTQDPPNRLEKVTDEYYKVYSEVQGFIKYNEKKSGLVAHEIFNIYRDVPSDLFEAFTKRYHKPYKTLAPSKWNYTKKNDVVESYTSSSVQDGRCLDFLFEILNPDPSDPLLFSTIVSIRASENTHITRPVIRANYDALTLGSNLASSGSITLEDIGVSANVNYQSIIEDIAPDKVEIRIGAFSLAQPDLIEITTSYTTLIKMNIQLPGPIDPSIILDQEMMTGLSKYFDFSEGIEKYFDCMRIEGDFGSFLCPEPAIVGIASNTLNSGLPHSPDLSNLVGGHDQYIAIFGECFGETQGSSYVEFKGAINGPDDNVWIRPRPQDYNVPFDLLPDNDPWTSTTIRVMIPSIGLDGSGLVESDFYAGTGNIRVVVNGVTSTWEGDPLPEPVLNIKYSLQNAFTNSTIDFPYHSVIARPVEHNDMGGYDFWYGEGMEDNISAQNSFELALLDWVCETEINFVIKDPSEIIDTDLQSEISFSDLGPGISSSTALASTPLNNQFCGYPDIAVGLKTSIDFVFNNNDDFTWYYETQTDGVELGQFELDFQSIALHEIGHAIGLNHSNNIDDVMYFRASNDFTRDLTPDASQGGIFMAQQGFSDVVPLDCGEDYGEAMIPLECGANSIEEYGANSTLISVYPNPSNDQIFIFDKLNRFNLSYKIFNVLGDIIMKGNSEKGDGIDINNIANGLYYISILDRNNLIGSYKFLKE